MNVQLDAAAIAEVFPFHFCVDRSGRVVSRGRSLDRVCPALEVNGAADEHVRVVRPPTRFDVAELFRHAPEFVVLEIGSSALVLRGQTFASGEHLFFLTSPWLTSPSQLEELGLSLTDFAPHDPVVDYLSLLQAKNSALADAGRLADELHAANRKLEESLNEKERVSSRLATLISRLPYGVITEDEQGRVVLANEKLCEMFSIPVPPEELVGIDCSAAAAQSKSLFRDPEGFVLSIENRLREMKPVVGEVFELGDGRVLERDFVPIEGACHYWGRLWQYRDVTERRLVEAQLANARARAEEANEAKGAFLAMMSHEMRTPLGVIVGLSDLLNDEVPEDERRVYLARLRVNAKNLLELVDDVLDFSKLESGNVELFAAPFDPVALIEEVRASLLVKAREKGLTLIAEVAPGVPMHVCGDAQRIRQVLVNLTHNAIKFTPSGHVKLTLSLRGETAQGVELRYEVSDSGPGIPKEKQELVFERFVRLCEDKTARVEGSGLGLSICRALVSKMGSQIVLDSERGRGARFSFDLRHERPATEQQAPRRPSHPVRASARVLLAEDDPDNRLMLTRLLERGGYQVTAVADGRRAKEELDRDIYDVLVTDVQMPDVDGLELARCVRKSEADTGRQRLPIIAVTAHALESYREHALRLGVDVYLTKPIVSDTLLKAVQAYIDHRPRILVVDDAEDSSDVIARQLTRIADVRVSTARTGERALRALERDSFALVFLDGSMPGLDGPETARAIRARVGADGFAPVLIALTGHTSASFLHKMREAGCAECLTKPASRAELENVLRSYLPHLFVKPLRPSSVPADPTGGGAPLDLHIDPDVADMIPGYLHNRRLDVLRLRNLLERGAELAEAQSIGHKMKGTGRAYGLSHLTDLGAAIENAGAEAERGRLHELCDELELYVDRVEQHLGMGAVARSAVLATRS